MKAQQNLLKAVFTEECDNAKHPTDKEKVSHYLVLDKKTERVIIDCRTYMGRSNSTSTVWASLWVNLRANKKPEGWVYAFTSGSGKAGGWGYHKESAAVQDAISSAGIELFGEVYSGQTPSDPKEFAKYKREIMKKRAYIDGVGDGAIKKALLTIAYAAGFNDVIYVNT